MRCRSRSVISAGDLGDGVEVIGLLGVPLGQVVEIEATVVDGDELRRKALEGRFLLRIEKVNGKNHKLAQPLTWQDRSGTMPATHDELVMMTAGKDSEPPTAAESKLLDEGFVGTRRRLLVYEVGEFGGVPTGLPLDYPMWANVGYGYQPSLVVLKESGG